MFADFPDMRSCRDFTGLSVEDLCKRPSEVRRRAAYVTRGAWRVTECSVPETRGELVAGRVTSCKCKFERSPFIERIKRVPVRLSIACDECLQHGDEPPVNSDRWMAARWSRCVDGFAYLLKLES